MGYTIPTLLLEPRQNCRTLAHPTWARSLQGSLQHQALNIHLSVRGPNNGQKRKHMHQVGLRVVDLTRHSSGQLLLDAPAWSSSSRDLALLGLHAKGARQVSSPRAPDFALACIAAAHMWGHTVRTSPAALQDHSASSCVVLLNFTCQRARTPDVGGEHHWLSAPSWQCPLTGPRHRA
eukprot:CAMPEP_0203857698 /NCGR_PEP_ID=MMETSP0359-20131031/10876_1 /ASSEMBLY_ACC=CAM_ASM_000338 /TAXON_ID=268821 /ORGANISM="Scrippsiella Hangoei, Strain SHTV-5" /LENGTH=177 /DNA_ID=CAMNT_0050774421 /DNA_START=95 /DNA_END=625 /DNA_ORIENTATION=+